MFTEICGSVLILAVFGLSQARAQTGSFERTLQVSGPVTMEVTSGSGNTLVHAGGNGIVHILAEIQARNSPALDFWICSFGSSAAEQIRKLESNPPIEQEGNTIHIGKMDDWLGDWLVPCNVSINYDLTVPQQTGLISHSGSGEVAIDGLQLSSSAATGSGKITVANIGGDVHLSSGSGGLNADSVKGALYAQTGSGRIKATSVAGEITAETGSGGVDIQQAAGGVNIRTASGRVNLRGIEGEVRVKTASGGAQVEGKPTGDWHIATVSGNIGLKTPPQVSFNFDAAGLSGNLKVDRPLMVQGSVSRNHLQGKAANGGVLIEAHTVSGKVEID